MINVLIIGSGLIGKMHAKYCIEHPNICLVGFVVSDVTRYQSLSHEFNCEIFASLNIACVNTEVDAVIIASPNNLHREHWLNCLELGLPALIEKPVFMSAKDALEIPTKYKENSVLQKYVVGHHRLYGSNLRTAREIIKSGKLGQIKLFNGLTAWHKPDYYFDDGGWRTLAEAGGGVIFINLIHEIATIQFLLGNIKEVFAFSTSPKRPFDVEDTATVVCRLESGAIGNLSITDCSPSDHSWEYNSGENLNYPHYNQDCLNICGDCGSLGLPSNTLMCHETTKDWWTPLQFLKSNDKYVDPLRAQLNAFHNLVCGEETEVVTLLDGLRNLSVVEAINLSLNTGKPQVVAEVNLI